MTDDVEPAWPADPRDDPLPYNKGNGQHVPPGGGTRPPTNGHDNSTTDITVTAGERHKAVAGTLNGRAVQRLPQRSFTRCSVSSSL
jgi:hypothetical protein